uniref:Uncharacterized protein n=1 Tax=Cryptomonas curvata TaxID=233186 RepID=A0A7S0MEU0_9CRYP|mmetsp:Transcript_37725/g.79013  ORF Transcript_37725/g.79013 Transcript_37725/m.79013 type:complete len:272 (+) Transcript_37725:1-816(+)
MNFPCFLAASIFILTPNALTSQTYAPPSARNEGYFDNQHCPVMLGKGFGPPAYKDLCDKWKNISSELRFSEQERTNVKRLISRMSSFDKCYSCEEVLSGIISTSCQLIFRKYGEESLMFEHQLSSTQKDEQWFIDIAITNGGDPNNFHCNTIHTLGEVKWEFSMDEFPEMKATAVAALMWKSGTIHLPWVPVFVLSQSHFSFGLAFNFYDVRWSYSEICEYHERSRFSIKSENDVMMLCRFSRFMHAAALYPERMSSSATAANNHEYLSSR